MAKITLDEEIKELKRELEIREKIYPSQVKFFKLDSIVAEYRVMVLKSVISRLEEQAHKNYGKQPEIFQ